MKKLLIILAFLPFFTGCNDKNTVEDVVALNKPEHFQVVAGANPSDAILSWTDNSNGEEKFRIERKANHESVFSGVTNAAANTTEYTDKNLTIGPVYEYRIAAINGKDTSEWATATYNSASAITVSLGTPEVSNYMVTVPIALKNAGSTPYELGICWSASNTSPTIEDDAKYVYYRQLSGNATAYGNATHLEPNTKYYVRAYAKSSNLTLYSSTEEITPPALTPIHATWTEDATHSFPDEVKLYSTSTTIGGRPVKAWYAIADLSTGNVELRTPMVSVAQKTSAFVTSTASTETTYVMANAGYFGGNVSYSFVRDRGTAKASNIATLTRSSIAYSITRGAFGVSQEGTPSMQWIYSTSLGTDYAYSRPLPVVEGQPALTPTAEFPTKRTSFAVYSGVGGAPILLQDGKLCFDYSKTGSVYKSNYELLQTDIFAKGVLQPRTAIGYTADNKVVIMVVDGRQSGISEGVTLDELGQLMLGIGCTHAMNLDGGGSTTMVATNSGTLVNTPSNSNAEERAVISFVGFVQKR